MEELLAQFRLLKLPDMTHLRYRMGYLHSDSVNDTNTISDLVTKVSKFYTEPLNEHYMKKTGDVSTFKSSSESVKFRTKGNEEFGKKEFLKSLQSYDEGICHAPVNSKELAFSFANRSAVLQKMGKLEECISDIHEAYKCGYPAKLKYKLLLREATCLRDLNDKSELAQDCFNSALEALQLSDLSEKDKQIEESRIMEQKGMKKMKVEESYKVYAATDVPLLVYGPNKELPCASKALDLRYDDHYGRHFVANANMKIGDVLMVEEPFTFKPGGSAGHLTKNKFHFCFHCLKICFNLIPCPNCTWARFCNETCLKEASAAYHGIECPVVSRLSLVEEKIQVDMMILVIRSIAKVGPTNIQKYLDRIDDVFNTDEEKRTRGFNSKGIYDSNDFLTLINLEINFSNHSKQMKLHNCMVAMAVTKCFNLQPDIINIHKFTIMVYKLMSTIKYNAIAITCNEFEKYNYGFTNIETSIVYSSIFPTLSLLSHSCNPNALATFYGSTLVVRAILPIKKKDQVTISYSHTWLSSDTKSRLSHLKEIYNFICKCDPCRENWPVGKTLLKKEDTYNFSFNTLTAYNEIVSGVTTFLIKLEPLLSNRKAHTKYFDKHLDNLSKVISALCNSRKKLLVHQFYFLNSQLLYLLRTYGNAIGNSK